MRKPNDKYVGREKMINHKLQITNYKSSPRLISFGTPLHFMERGIKGVGWVILVLCLFISSAVFADGVLSDPTTIGVGARALGMGKAYVGMAEDGDALFINPAGLARITNPKFSSMYTSLLGDISYAVIGGVYPSGAKSAFGAGYLGASVSDIPLTDTTGAPLGSGRWSNNVLFLSYGTYLSELPVSLKLGRDVLVGGTFKYFSISGSGTGSVEAGTGSGMNIDLGLLYPLNDSATLGINLQNALSPSSGGKITKSSGSVDTLPTILKVGTKLNLVGKEGAIFSTHSTRRLYGNIDYDVYPGSSRAALLHLGGEFWPTNNLALRIGSDNNDLTAGVGIRFSGIEFNYAYHPYSGIAENTTHYFSLGYLGEGQKRELKITIDEPRDKAIVYGDSVKVSGKVAVVEGDEPVKGFLNVKVNGVNARVAADNTFSAEIPVENYGKKLMVVEASDTAGNYQKEEARLLRLNSFADIPDGYWAKQPIENNATVGLVQGFPDGTFRPEDALTRAELAALLVRAKGIKMPEGGTKQVFKDVKSDFWASRYIEVAQRERLIKGYPDKTFRPNSKISKAEGIAVLARFDGLRLAAVEAKPYWDVSTVHWSAKYIQAAKEAGMLKYVERNRLHPQETLARSESIEMLGKTQLAGGKIKDLYTWEKGFKFEEARPQIKASL
jgi:hypothetical protein